MENSVFPFLKSFNEHDQICHLYNNDSECYEIAANYFIHGIKSGNSCLYVSDCHAPRELLKRLEGHGIAHQESPKGRAFEELVISNHTKELGRADEIIAVIEKGIDKVIKIGKKPVRVLIVLNSDPFLYLANSEKLWMKAYLNKMCLEKPVIMMSQFNIERISA